MHCTDNESERREINMDLNKTGLFISALRKQNGLTQKELAEKIGVTDKAVSRWETGKGFPDVSILKLLAEVLNVSITEIVNGEKPYLKILRKSRIMLSLKL
ncbi:MAG TPA: helix-turn-helix transcriptional regulator [Eubacteriales bacterium]|nr:helix-turn-helix transcriptional regulator [Clostridia bacterium]HRR89417.1 helix-turn-helix transcriptional regulator [Eubacteriales bacterium]HRU84838.1 helix-turn-helix transcriptional regulator [Eubacteriales bacterium]